MRRSFRSRLIWVVLLSAGGVSFIVILLTTFQYVMAHIRNEQELAQKQEEIIQNALRQELESIFQLGSMMKNDTVLQQYMEEPERSLDGKFLNDVSRSLINYKKLNQNISHISLLRYENESIRYVGSAWRADKRGLYEKLQDAWQQADYVGNKSAKMIMKADVFSDQEQVLDIFFPVFDSYEVYRELGVICIGVPEEMIRAFYAGNFFDNIFVLDRDGTVLSCQNTDEIGTRYENWEWIDIEKVIQYSHGIYFLNSAIESTGWNILAEISLSRILKSAAGVLLQSFFVMCFMCASLLIYCYRTAQKLIHPVEDLKQRMGAVAQGDMSIRMDIEYAEDEFNEMAKSFNVMVKNVDRLMERIREEQIQLQKIKLSVLQEQIKPHFLYNTLECIHMQAVIDGNEEISRLVMALASYYRLCLGKGQDILTLRQEVQHIENYLIIQNVRYGNIIHLEKNIPEALENIKMLKMTLQPLVENSIYHGIRVKEGKRGNITISARREDERMLILVADDGIGMEDEQIRELNEKIKTYDAKNGYGVRNVNRRIQIFFGVQYGLTYRKNPGGGTVVEIRIPYQS